MLFAETEVRSGLGLGARSLMVYEVNNQNILRTKVLKNLEKGFDMLLNRKVQNIFQRIRISKARSV